MAIELGQRLTPIEALELAINEGKKGAGFVSPNPLVGCVILDPDFRLLSYGHHTAVGKPHAEIEALQKVDDKSRLKGAHLFVTLEPCAHQGRTPPCATALAQIPFASVTYGVQDPNPLVAGKGANTVEGAGIEVLNVLAASPKQFARFFEKLSQDVPHVSGWIHNWSQDGDWSERQLSQLKADLEELAEIFLHSMRTRMPFVALKVATSLDGQMGLRSGESKWITGTESRLHAHFLRASYDVVLIGRNTFTTDNPSLNVRHPVFPNHRNRVALIDFEGKTISHLPKSKLWKSHEPEDIFVLTNSKEASRLKIPAENIIGVKSLKEALAAFGERGLTSILVEGGSHTFGHFIKDNLVNRIYVFLAPVLIGAQMGLSWTQNMAIDKLENKIRLLNSRKQLLGDDLLITGVVNTKTSSSL